MAGKTEITLRIVEAALGKLLPAVLDLIAQRKRLKRAIETGEEPSEAECAAADADLDAAVQRLRRELLPGQPTHEPLEPLCDALEAEPESAEGQPEEELP